jgi:hypothetical protein
MTVQQGRSISQKAEVEVKVKRRTDSFFSALTSSLTFQRRGRMFSASC